MDKHIHDTPSAPLFPTESKIFFDVREQPLITGVYDANNTLHRMQGIKSHKALVRNDNGNARPIAIVGADYGLVTMREQCQAIEDMLVKELRPFELDGVQTHDRMAYHGATCFREYTFPNIKTDVNPQRHLAKDTIHFRITLRGSYGRDSISCMYGAHRLVCLNGMVVGEFDAIVRRHSKHVHVSDITRKLRRGIDVFHEQSARWNTWAQRPIDVGIADEFFSSVIANDTNHNTLSRRMFDEYLRQRLDGGDTVWTLYNTLTYYASHDEGAFATRKTANDHSAATMFDRGRAVRRWTESDEFQKLVA